MEVTQKQLRVHGLQQCAKWFSYHFKNSAIRYEVGTKGLQSVYDTNDLKNYTSTYLKRIETNPLVVRHKSPERFEELLNSIRSFECKV